VALEETSTSTVPRKYAEEGDDTQRKQDRREKKRSDRKSEKKANAESGRPKTAVVKNGKDLVELETGEGSVPSAALIISK
jgi:hypothetical protein